MSKSEETVAQPRHHDNDKAEQRPTRTDSDNNPTNDELQPKYSHKSSHVSFNDRLISNGLDENILTTNGNVADEDDEFESPKNEISMIPPRASPEESLDGSVKRPDDEEEDLMSEKEVNGFRWCRDQDTSV